MATNVDGDKIQVVAVCNNEAAIYDVADGYGHRKLLTRHIFSNRGQALLFAQEHEAKQKKRAKPTKEEVIARRNSRKSHKPINEEQTA